MIAHFRRRISSIVVLTIFVTVAVAGSVCWHLAAQRPSPMACFQAGLKAYRNGDRALLWDAIELLDTSPRFQPHCHLLRAAHAVLNQSLETAFRELSRLQPEGELREPALLISGEACYRAGRLADAQQLFATVAREQTEDTEAHRWLAAIAYDLGAFDDATKELEIVIRQNPTDYHPFVLIGQMLSDTERYSAAQVAYANAVANHPPPEILVELLPNLARTQLKQRDYAGALETLSRANRSAVTLALKAEAEYGLGNPETARRLVDDALQIHALDPSALALSGRFYFDAGLPHLAIAPLRQVLEQDPHDFESRYQLAQALLALGQAEEAEVQSKLWSETVKLRERLAKLTELANQNTKDAEVRDQIATLCDALGKPELGQSWRNAAANCRVSNRR